MGQISVKQIISVYTAAKRREREREWGGEWYDKQIINEQPEWSAHWRNAQVNGHAAVNSLQLIQSIYRYYNTRLDSTY